MSELSDKALTAIQDAVRVEILTDKAGNEYSTKSISRLEPPKLPAPGLFELSTLTGLADFCENHKEKKGPKDPAVICISGPSLVCLYSEPFGPQCQRTLFVKASFGALLGESFRFGQFYEQEEFVISLQSLFEPTPPRAEVLKVIGTIKENQVREFSDDGVTQSVSAKAGIALVSEIAVPNPVILRPYRTFREIGQPESPFILRVKQGKGEKPMCALFEADGGRWKLDAMLAIKEYLEDHTTLPVIA
jgi:hypothetical protein